MLHLAGLHSDNLSQAAKTMQEVITQARKSRKTGKHVSSTSTTPSKTKSTSMNAPSARARNDSTLRRTTSKKVKINPLVKYLDSKET